VARRVLRGLGLVQRQLPYIERLLFSCEPDFDEALWPRVRRAWDQLLVNTANSRYFRLHQVEVLEIPKKDKHKDVLDRFELIDSDTWPKPVFMTRIRGTTQSITYSAQSSEGLGENTPPFWVVALVNGLFIVTQDTTQYVERLGPYNVGSG